MSGPVHFPGVRPVPLLIAASAVLLAMPGLAQHQGHGGYGGVQGGPGWHGGGYGGGHGAPGWHGGYGGHGAHGGPAWRGGYWHHGEHGGRDGWWWVAGPSWYYYPAPVYPYPYPYPYAYGPPLAAGLPPGYLFYCPSFGAYTTYMAACPGGGMVVPAGP
jgi:hypothetical protein